MVTEADTRAELIDVKLAECGWKTGGDIKIRREFPIKAGRIVGVNQRNSRLLADYVLVYKNINIAVVEAKKSSKAYTEGVAQAKEYATLLNIRFTYSTNGKKIYQIDMQTGEEKLVENYPTPQELWEMTYKEDSKLWETLASIPMNTGGRFKARYYQENAVNAVTKAISQGKKRILLTLATGTGKTCIAFQTAWKLMQARWNTQEVDARLPKILFLADRNILADQAYNSFGQFDQNALARIKPEEVKKTGTVPTSQSIFFTIFQTFMSGDEPYFGQYPKDFFDFIIIDECHRGGANDESTWRKILEYFDSAVQLGLTATPKRKNNVDTYEYFGEPVYEYSLKDAIDDGFLTPFRVREITDNFGTYEYNIEDYIEGDIDKERTYQEPDFNKNIILKEREVARVKAFMNEINQNEKTLVFCATQNHAGLVRDIINQVKTVTNDVNYCVRVTADDGAIGEENLRKFQDTEKTIPTILTTSQKLSTGVDAIQIRNIVLLRPVNSMIEFKQIVGRGTRMCDGKAYFTIYDFVNASHNFEDKEWDGPTEYVGNKSGGHHGRNENQKEKSPKPVVEEKPKTIITLGGGRTVTITNSKTTFYDNESGKPISAKAFIEKLIGKIPEFFKSEEELREIWSRPETRRTLLRKFKEQGYTKETFDQIKEVITAQNNDVFDVLEYLAYNTEMLSRNERVEMSKIRVFNNIESRKHAFINFVLQQYIKNGVGELDDSRIGELIKLKYGSPVNAINELGTIDDIRNVFCDFQKYLYQVKKDIKDAV